MSGYIIFACIIRILRLIDIFAIDIFGGNSIVHVTLERGVVRSLEKGHTAHKNFEFRKLLFNCYVSLCRKPL